MRAFEFLYTLKLYNSDDTVTGMCIWKYGHYYWLVYVNSKNVGAVETELCKVLFFNLLRERERERESSRHIDRG